MRRQGTLGQPVQFVLSIMITLGVVMLATAAAWPIYETPRLAAVALAGFASGAAVALGSRLFGLRWWVVAPVTLVLYAVIAVPVAIPSALTSPGSVARAMLEALESIVTGWKHLATVSLPAGEYQAVLTPFLITIMVGSLVSLLLAWSGSARAPWAAAPLLTMVIFGSAFGDPDPGAMWTLGPIAVPAARNVAIAASAAGLLVAWLVLRARLERSDTLKIARSQATTVHQRGASVALAARRQVLALAIVMGAVSAAVLAAPGANMLTPREVIRESVEPVVALASQPSPLTSYRGYFTAESFNEPLFSVAGVDGIERIRIATLDTYDGVTFHVGEGESEGRFAREPLTQDGNLQITILEGYRGIWVPVADTQSGAPQFQGARASVLAKSYYANSSLNSGLVVTDDAESGIGLRSGDSYVIGATASHVDASTLMAASGGDSLIAAEDFPALTAWVDSQDLGRSGADLLELIDRLRSRGYLSHSVASDGQSALWEAALPGYSFEPSRAGHSRARIETLFQDLLDQQLRAGDNSSADALVAAVGDDEQFAVASAMLARYLGFDSRVAIGVRLSNVEDGSPIAACVDTCTGAHVAAWVEIRTPQGDWLPVDVTPQSTQPLTRIREGENLPRNPTVAQLPQTNVVEPPSSQGESTATSSTTTDTPAIDQWSVSRTAVIVLSAAVSSILMVLPFLVFPLAKASRRRWRRHAPAPEVALVGAWSELIDAYRDYGLDVPLRLTRGETSDVMGRPIASELAFMVDAAVFSEHPPTRASSDAAWSLVDEERDNLRQERSLPRRLRAALTFASLRDGLSPDHIPHLSTHSMERSSRVS